MTTDLPSKKTEGKKNALLTRVSVALSTLLVMVMGLVAPAAAGPVINGTILDLLTAVVSVLPSFLNLVIAVAPLIITIAVIGFIVLFIRQILEMMNL
jgi:ABC-type dipeptide/oligopeptide/nickel transport system permease subunit